jgi:DNA-binding transcriptional MerR regulator
MSAAYSLNDLSEATGIEARTIRSYIERGLLPSANTRGRGASYSADHLSRLQAIQALRRARPTISLDEIRILLHQLTPAQLRGISAGSITAGTTSAEPAEDEADEELPIERALDWTEAATNLTGIERLVRILRGVSSLPASERQSAIEGWKRIAITPDVELCVRAEFSSDQLAAFQELAGQLRHLFEFPDALTRIEANDP